MKQSQRIVKNAFFGIGGSVIGGLVYLAAMIAIFLTAHSREPLPSPSGRGLG